MWNRQREAEAAREALKRAEAQEPSIRREPAHASGAGEIPGARGWAKAPEPAAVS